MIIYPILYPREIICSILYEIALVICEVNALNFNESHKNKENLS